MPRAGRTAVVKFGESVRITFLKEELYVYFDCAGGQHCSRVNCERNEYFYYLSKKHIQKAESSV